MKYFFRRFLRSNNTVKIIVKSKNIILRMQNRQRLETQPNVYLYNTYIQNTNDFFLFCFVQVFFLPTYTGDFYLLSVAKQPYLHNKRSQGKKWRTHTHTNEFQSICSTTWGSSHVFRISLLQFRKYKQMFRIQISLGF